MAKDSHVCERLKPHEDTGRLIKRFIRKVRKQKIKQKFLERTSFYIKPSEKRRKRRKAKRRLIEKQILADKEGGLY